MYCPCASFFRNWLMPTVFTPVSTPVTTNPNLPSRTSVPSAAGAAACGAGALACGAGALAAGAGVLAFGAAAADDVAAAFFEELFAAIPAMPKQPPHSSTTAPITIQGQTVRFLGGCGGYGPVGGGCPY